MNSEVCKCLCTMRVVLRRLSCGFNVSTASHTCVCCFAFHGAVARTCSHTLSRVTFIVEVLSLAPYRSTVVFCVNVGDCTIFVFGRDIVLGMVFIAHGSRYLFLHYVPYLGVLFYVYRTNIAFFGYSFLLL